MRDSYSSAYLRNFGVLIPEQFGFRVGHATTHQMMRLVEVITRAGCLGEQTVTCFLDVEKASLERRITAGVPQGSVLGPLLFSVFVNDVPREPGVQIVLFADDTAVYTVDRCSDRAVIRLQPQLDAFEDWTDD